MLEMDRSWACGVLLGNEDTGRDEMTAIYHNTCSHGEEDVSMLPMCVSYRVESQSSIGRHDLACLNGASKAGVLIPVYTTNMGSMYVRCTIETFSVQYLDHPF